MKKKMIISLLVMSLSVICVSPAFAVSPSGKMNSKDYSSYASVNFQSFDATLANDKNTSGYANMSVSSFDDYITVEPIVTPIDENTFQVSEPDGTVIGTYTIFPDDVVLSRASWKLYWEAAPGQLVGGDDSITSYQGLTYTYNIACVPGGASQLGILAHDVGLFYPMRTSSTGKFVGAFSLDKSYGHIALGIKNISKNTVVYSGIYSI